MKSMALPAALAASLALAGCSPDPNLDGGSIATIPVKGKVTKADGKPLTEGGVITLEPLVGGGSTNQAVGTIGDDGTFTVDSSASAKGAMAGKYRVKIETADLSKTLTKAGKEIQVEVKPGEDLEVKLP